MRKEIAPSSRSFFVRGMEGHSAVLSIKPVGGDVYLIERTKDRPDLRVLIADIYIAGESDIIEITYDYSNIDCIVLVGFYNRYSGAAKDFARERNIGLYDKSEFFGAVNFVGNEFLNYVKKEKR